MPARAQHLALLAEDVVLAARRDGAVEVVDQQHLHSRPLRDGRRNDGHRRRRRSCGGRCSGQALAALERGVRGVGERHRELADPRLGIRCGKLPALDGTRQVVAAPRLQQASAALAGDAGSK